MKKLLLLVLVGLALIAASPAVDPPPSAEALRLTAQAIDLGEPPFVVTPDLAAELEALGATDLNVCEGAIDWACRDSFSECTPWQATLMDGSCEDPVYTNGGSCWFYPSFGEASSNCAPAAESPGGGGGGIPTPPPGGQKVCAYGFWSDQPNPPPDYQVPPGHWVEGSPYNWMICHWQ